jgi:hypothetical protein
MDKAVLLAPNPPAKAVAMAAKLPEEAKPVRESYIAEVLRPEQ